MSTRRVRKISETILDFAGPIICEFDTETPPEAIRSAMQFVITVWNAHATALPRWGQPQFLADLHQKMQDPLVPPETLALVRMLSQRRTLPRFASDGRAVGEWSIVGEAGAWRLRCDARAPADN